MYEVTHNVNLSSKVDALSKKKRLIYDLKGLESMTQILDSHTKSIAKLETQIGQLPNAISKRDEGKLPSHPIENPRTNYHELHKIDESLPYILELTLVPLEYLFLHSLMNTIAPYTSLTLVIGDNLMLVC
ncbi:hypothetical protein M9H77_18003 [Catharanthus roseus]|uniref:Uncharacterized protein n=1 Tax=Catharanthus roseus TaxID=4058 RepID=A0ACC0B672_CATRO|nr:hypothetical protein M9H77_18003 [Catharanthus roseus]